jgi:hypothetical protein
VSERWVCKRCYASNEATAGVCARCGLTRGAEASQADQAAWAAQGGGGAQSTPRDWRRWLGYAWIPVVATVLIVGYLASARRADDGSITTAGTVSIGDLQVGDCFNVSEGEEITEVDGVPCTEAHEYEVFALATYEGDGTFPTEDEGDAIFTQLCNGPFATYVGEPYSTSEIYASMISPTEDGWADGDHEFICVLYELDNPQVTESLRGANR